MRVEVHGVSKIYRSRGESVRAVDSLSIGVADGEMLVLLGPSGSGKTTLLRCIAGLEVPDEGEISIEGRLVYSSMSGVWVPPEKRGIGMVFQGYALWPHMTAYENVAYPLQSRGVAASAIRERVSNALALVGCSALERRHPSELSGGQQQRIALARAVVGGSSVILFDEPLSSVDARVREDLRHEIVSLQRDLGFSAIYITHDQTEAMAIGHRIAVLDDGRIAQIATPKELYDIPATSRVAEFVGVTNHLAGEIVGEDGTWTVVETELGTMRAKNGANDFPRATRVTVVNRPDNCRIVTGPVTESEWNRWPCRIEQSIFLGYCTEYLVQVRETVVAVRSDHAVVGETEANYWLEIDPEHLLIVAAE